jgi:prevent-host-death family protein
MVYYRAAMKPSTDVRSISHLKANAADIVRELKTHRRALVITQNGEATAVLQDVRSWEEQQEALALLKILALGKAQIDRGQTVSVKEAFKRARKRRH